MCPEITGILASGVGVNKAEKTYDVQHSISMTLKAGDFYLYNKGKIL
jgi:hypothetical protein